MSDSDTHQDRDSEKEKVDDAPTTSKEYILKQKKTDVERQKCCREKRKHAEIQEKKLLEDVELRKKREKAEKQKLYREAKKESKMKEKEAEERTSVENDTAKLSEKRVDEDTPTTSKQYNLRLRKTDAERQKCCREKRKHTEEQEQKLLEDMELRKKREKADKQKLYREAKKESKIREKEAEERTAVEKDAAKPREKRVFEDTPTTSKQYNLRLGNTDAERQKRCREKQKHAEVEEQKLLEDMELRKKREKADKQKQYREAKKESKIKEKETEKRKAFEEEAANLKKKRVYRRIYRGRKLNNTTNSERMNDGVIEHYLGKMDVKCIHCNALHFEGERVGNGDSFGDCCSHGTVLPKSFSEFPDELRELFDGTDENSRRFIENIRVYNSSLSFASFNANLVNFGNRRPGPYCFKIQGQVYYQINTSLYPENNEVPSYGQLFIIDADEANEHRKNNFEGLDEDILKKLDHIMRLHNLFAKSYFMMSEEVEKEKRKCEENGNSMPDITMVLNVSSWESRHRYNPQKTNEVAAIFSTTADGEIPESYFSIRNKNTRKLTYMSTMDPNVDPMLYPVLFPNGEHGYNSTQNHLNKTKRVSRSEYVRNSIADRDEFNPFLLAGKLFQQFVVDSYIKIERDRMTYIRNQQKEIRCDTYQGLMDYLNKKGHENNMGVGKIVILPSTFIGSPRNMAQNYQDALAIVRKYGKPDLFVTLR